jgi:group I intron endonuclease
MKNYLIYMFTSPNGKQYIGQTCNFSRRISEHRGSSTKCRVIHNAITKYGFENFDLSILEENLSIEEANLMERYYIEKFNTISPNGYNLRYGGKSGGNLSDETKKLIGEKSKGRRWEMSKETKIKLSEEKIGNKNPMYGRSGVLSPVFGKVVSEERKDLRRKNYLVTFPDGRQEIIRGLREFCEANNLTYSVMKNVANGYNNIHKGFNCELYK